MNKHKEKLKAAFELREEHHQENLKNALAENNKKTMMFGFGYDGEDLERESYLGSDESNGNESWRNDDSDYSSVSLDHLPLDQSSSILLRKTRSQSSNPDMNLKKPELFTSRRRAVSQSLKNSFDSQVSDDGDNNNNDNNNNDDDNNDDDNGITDSHDGKNDVVVKRNERKNTLDSGEGKRDNKVEKSYKTKKKLNKKVSESVSAGWGGSVDDISCSSSSPIALSGGDGDRRRIIHSKRRVHLRNERNKKSEKEVSEESHKDDNDDGDGGEEEVDVETRVEQFLEEDEDGVKAIVKKLNLEDVKERKKKKNQKMRKMMIMMMMMMRKKKRSFNKY
jgi:hypothetical protein